MAMYWAASTKVKQALCARLGSRSGNIQKCVFVRGKKKSSSIMGGTSARPIQTSQFVLKSEEAQFVKSTVAEHPVVIFSKTQCSYCRTAKSIFDNLGVDYKTYELDMRNDGPILQDVLEAMTQTRTVPRVFIKGQCIGGCSDLQSLQASGQLQDMIGNNNKN